MRRIKKRNILLLLIYLIASIFYIVTYVILCKNAISYTGVETKLRISLLVLFGIYLLVWLIFGLHNIIAKKYQSYIIMLVFTVLFSLAFSFASYYLGGLYNAIDNMSKEVVNYGSVLVKLKDKQFDAKTKIGMINDDSDVEGYVIAKDILKENNINNQIQSYDDYYLMLDELYSGKIGACFLSTNYEILYSGEEKFKNIATDLEIIYSKSEEKENRDNVQLTNKTLTEPFTILVMGVDSEINGLNANQAFNGDTLMMITFNPKTLNATVFSVPRDTYVPIACRNGAYAKINSSAARGTSCVISTISQLTGIDVDYYIKVNFKGVVDLVDALGGVEVNVQKPDFTYNVGVDYHGQVCEQNSNREFGSKMVCMDPGLQVLNGEQALSYSRDRHQYLLSDLARIKHQQDVVEAILAKVKNIRTYEQFKALLDSISKNIDTNMTTGQILSLYDVVKSIALGGSNSSLKFNKSYLETYNLPVWTGSSTTSALGYYRSSMEAITKMMKVNLGLEKPTINKTFTIDYADDYKTRAVGEGLRSNPGEGVIPNLVGSSKDYALSWATNNNINATVETILNDNEKYNSSYAPGIVIEQSLHQGSLIKSGDAVTFYINGPAKEEEKPKEGDTIIETNDEEESVEEKVQEKEVSTDEEKN